MTRRWPIAIVIAVLATQFNLAQAPDSSLPIDIDVPSTPIAVRGAGASHLFYEIHLTNFRPLPLELTRVDVLASDGRPVASYTAQEIEASLSRPGMPADLKDKRTLGAGVRAVLMLHLRFDGDRPVPMLLRHRLTFTIQGADGTPREESIEAGRVSVSSERPLTIDPPLRGGDWVALNGPSNNSVHRRALLVVNGTARIAQRFAIDWVKLGPGGRLTHDDRSRNENWHGYGEEVLAVTDGTVIATRDGIPDNVPLTSSWSISATGATQRSGTSFRRRCA